jgi:hypothetical protein
VKLKYSAILILLCLPLTLVGKSGSRDLVSAERKISHIESNAHSRRPNQSPTVFNEAEVNAYLASDNVRLPAGVESVKLEGEDGVITGNARVDFDRIREGAHSSNPLLSIFSGVHDVEVVAHAHGAQGRGHVHVDSVSIDDIEVPHFVLQLFVDKFLTPKYPDLGIDSQFAMPDRIDSATVGNHELTIIQK